MLESLFNKIDSKDIKEAQTQMFSCEYCGIFKNTFFTELLSVAASAVLKKFVDSQENIGDGGSIHLYFFTNTTEFNKMLMCY